MQPTVRPTKNTILNNFLPIVAPEPIKNSTYSYPIIKKGKVTLTKFQKTEVSTCFSVRVKDEKIKKKAVYGKVMRPWV